MEKGLFKFPPLNSGIHYKKTQNLSSNRLMTLKSTTKHHFFNKISASLYYIDYYIVNLFLILPIALQNIVVIF